VSFTTEPSQARRDSSIAPAVRLEIRDSSGARIAGATNMVTLALGASPGAATLAGTTSAAAVDGIATFSDLHVAVRGRAYTIVATSGSLKPDTSVAFDIVTPLIPYSVSPGTEHTCAQVGHGIYCWGRNDNGELGDSTLTLRTLPVPVPFTPPFGAAFNAPALGDSHTCATTSVAELYCWGSDSSGQLGIGSQNDRRTYPALVSGGLSFALVTAGRAHTCAQIAGAYELYCWGANDKGQLGDSTNTLRPAPVRVGGGVALGSATAGRDHTCALTVPDGAAYCWGDNAFGQLGDGSTSARNSPVPVAGGHTFSQISAGGNHTCGLTNTPSTPEVYCWGDNADGELGDSTTTQRLFPVKVAGVVTFDAIAVGSRFGCGQSIDQKLYCWGRNLDGQLGIGSFTNQPAPQNAVDGSANTTGIKSGDRHVCTTTFDGAAYCWGANTFGQLGDGTRATRARPVLILY
jgi:alpha-tubulin suppressor-like RCC1 family protein